MKIFLENKRTKNKALRAHFAHKKLVKLVINVMLFKLILFKIKTFGELSPRFAALGRTAAGCAALGMRFSRRGIRGSS